LRKENDMTEIEKAIDTLKCIYPSKKEIASGEYSDVAEAIDAALEALREKADREKGCEFCTNFLFGIRCEVMYDWADDKKAVWETNVMHFCPMCGKKLKGADE
jgi:hypothetical protein